MPPRSNAQEVFENNPRSWYPFFVFLLAVLPFLAALNNGFVWDDHLIAGPEAPSRSVADSFARPFVLGSKTTPYYRPMVSLSLATDRAIWGDRPTGFHGTNVLLHGAASVFLYAVAANFMSAPIALLAAGFFAVHPVHAEAVAFISGRSDVLAGFFLLAAVALLLLAERGKSGQAMSRFPLWASAIAFFFALLSKESALLSPLIIGAVLCVGSPGHGSRPQFLVSRGWPFVIAGVVYGALRWHAFSGQLEIAGKLVFKPDVELVLPVLLRAAQLLVFPYRLSPYHDLRPYAALASAAAGLAVILAVGALLVIGMRLRWSLVYILGFLFLSVPLIPTLPLLSREGAPLAERFLYLPVAGCSLLGGALLDKAPVGRAKARMFFVAASTLLVAMGLWAAERARDWRNDLTLFSRAARLSPDNAVVVGLFGEALMGAGDLAGAEQALRRATALDPDLIDPWLALVRLYRTTAQTGPARAAYLHMIERDPGNARFRYELGVLELESGRMTEAERSFIHTLRIDSGHVDAYVNLGVIAHAAGNMELAAGYWRKALALDPGNALASGNLRAVAAELAPK